MRIHNLSDYKRGWLVGNFDPSIISSNDIEVAIHHYKSGEKHEAHYHKVATEINVIVSGLCNFKIWSKNKPIQLTLVGNKDDIIIIEPYDTIEFSAIKNTTILCIKTPSCKNDKYLI